jgi:transglutaminase-like putative cysteine protease
MVKNDRMSSFFRPVNALYHKIGGINLFILGFLLIDIQILVTGITHEIIDVQAVFLIPFAMGAVLLGWLAGMSPMNGLVAAFILTALGLEWTLMHVGGLWSAFEDVILVITRTTLRVDAFKGWQIAFPEVQPVISHFATEISAIGLQIFLFGKAVFTGEMIYDQVVVSLIWSLAVFFMSAWAAWWSTRHKAPWMGFLPGAGLMAGVFAFTDSGYNRLIAYAGLAIFAQIMLNYLQWESSWQARKIDTSYLRSDYTRSALIICFALAGLAWIAPSISPQDVKDFVEYVFTNDKKDSPQSKSSEPEPHPGHTQPFQSATRPELARHHLIGSGPNLQKNVVMYVYIDGYTPTDQVPQNLRPGEVPIMPLRLYWRSLTYDRYSGDGWSTSSFEEVDLSADQPLNESNPSEQTNRRIIQQDVQGIGDLGGYLYVTGELLKTNQAYRVGIRTNHDLVGATTDMQEYQSTSLISIATPDQLRSAGSNYPLWIRQRYLSLPGSVGPRVRKLALDLTATQSNPYDQALAIEQYLRQFPYTLEVDAPPAGVEITEFFVYELKKGYCDYYATSMVVLARAAGLPSRLVVGYASGSWDPVKGAYVVTEADAHSWAEVYFPGYGWIEFEPTGGLPRFEREQRSPPIEITALPESLKAWQAANRPGFFGKTNWFILSLGTFTLFLLGYILFTNDQRRLRRLSGICLVDTLYRRMLNHSRSLVGTRDTGLTPYEYHQRLLVEMNSFAVQNPASREVTERLVSNIQCLVDLYVMVSYSTAGLTGMNKEIAIKSWRKLNRDLLLASGLRKWHIWREQHKVRR